MQCGGAAVIRDPSPSPVLDPRTEEEERSREGTGAWELRNSAPWSSALGTRASWHRAICGTGLQGGLGTLGGQASSVAPAETQPRGGSLKTYMLYHSRKGVRGARIGRSSLRARKGRWTTLSQPPPPAGGAPPGAHTFHPSAGSSAPRHFAHGPARARSAQRQALPPGGRREGLPAFLALLQPSWGGTWKRQFRGSYFAGRLDWCPAPVCPAATAGLRALHHVTTCSTCQVTVHLHALLPCAQGLQPSTRVPSPEAGHQHRCRADRGRPHPQSPQRKCPCSAHKGWPRRAAPCGLRQTTAGGQTEMDPTYRPPTVARVLQQRRTGCWTVGS